MKHVVIDASAILNVLLDGPFYDPLRACVRGADLAAPKCLPYEVGNGLVNTVRKTRASDHPLTLAEALQAYDAFQTIPYRGMDVSVADAIEKAHLHETYLYDTLYTQLARRLGVALVSTDRGQRRIALAEGTPVLPEGLFSGEPGYSEPDQSEPDQSELARDEPSEPDSE